MYFFAHFPALLGRFSYFKSTFKYICRSRVNGHLPWRLQNSLFLPIYINALSGTPFLTIHKGASAKLAQSRRKAFAAPNPLTEAAPRGYLPHGNADWNGEWLE
jgi:hypothetical protein